MMDSDNDLTQAVFIKLTKIVFNMPCVCSLGYERVRGEFESIR